MNILKNKTVILIAFLAAVSITPAMAAGKGLSRDPQEKGTHRIMTCNIRITGLPEDAKKPGCTWEERREVCRDVILAQKPDIICLQEVIYDSNEYMKKELKGYTSFGFAGPEMDPFTEGYHFIGKNVIFFLTSKYEMLGAGCYWLSEEPLIGGTVSWGTTRARHCNYLRLRDKKTGEEFRIIDTHLDHKSDNARREQARMLAEEAGQYADDFRRSSVEISIQASLTARPRRCTWQDGKTPTNGWDSRTVSPFTGSKARSTPRRTPASISSTCTARSSRFTAA